jgi:hypothetical protein
MSLLTDFIATVAPQAQEIIGAENLTIGGGTAVAGVMSESAASKAFGAFGMDGGMGLAVVVRKAVFVAAYPLASLSYVGKIATARGESWRVAGIEMGAAFVTVRLADKDTVQ